jgi:hypothetical protein
VQTGAPLDIFGSLFAGFDSRRLHIISISYVSIRQFCRHAVRATIQKARSILRLQRIRSSRISLPVERYAEGNIMASKAFRAIEAGMKDAIAYLDGDKTKGVATTVEVPNLDVARCARRRVCRRTDLPAPSRSTPRRSATENRGGRGRMERPECSSR